MAGEIPLHTALIYAMVVVSGADGTMRNIELERIGQLVTRWPVFANFNQEMLVQTTRDCATIIHEAEGLQTVLGLIRAAVPERLRDTAYALACEVAAADRRYASAEQQVLEYLRIALELDRLTAAALERAAQARTRRIQD
jgi:tellurite resistance protein